MIHYHGGPITPTEAAFRVWKGRHAFVSFAHPQQINLAASVSQSFSMDNGAFSFWKKNKPVNWRDYYAWVWKWRQHPGFDFAVVPDLIGGTELQNDELAAAWPFPRHQGAVVWHTGESLDRLWRLANDWPFVAIGSSDEYDVKTPSKFLAYAKESLASICHNGFPICKLHGLRMLNPKIFTELPLSSADSTNVARNIGLDKNWRGTYTPTSKETRGQIIAERIESFTGACRLTMSSITDDATSREKGIKRRAFDDAAIGRLI